MAWYGMMWCGTVCHDYLWIRWFPGFYLWSPKIRKIPEIFISIWDLCQSLMFGEVSNCFYLLVIPYNTWWYCMAQALVNQNQNISELTPTWWITANSPKTLPGLGCQTIGYWYQGNKNTDESCTTFTTFTSENATTFCRQLWNCLIEVPVLCLCFWWDQL